MSDNTEPDPEGTRLAELLGSALGGPVIDAEATGEAGPGADPSQASPSAVAASRECSGVVAGEGSDGSDGERERILQRAERAEAQLDELENAITWHTSCTSCARTLDAAYAETVRRERAERKLARVAQICRTIGQVSAERIMAIIGTDEEEDGYDRDFAGPVL